MKASTLIKVLSASHYSFMVKTEWQQRGAIFLVSPPGQLKTTFLEKLQNFRGVHYTTDLNLQALGKLKGEMSANRIRTLIVPDFQKVYERHSNVSANVEGALRAMIEEGFTATAYQDSSVITRKARVLLLAACVDDFYGKKLKDWKDTGFARRVLFSSFVLKRPDILLDSFLHQKRLTLEGEFSVNGSRLIDWNLEDKEVLALERYLKQQPDSTPLALLSKIACVLRFWFRQRKVKDETMEIMRDFSQSLSGEGAEVEL